MDLLKVFDKCDKVLRCLNKRKHFSFILSCTTLWANLAGNNLTDDI